MKTLPWLISATVHGLVLLIGALSLQQAVVGIAPGRNALQVNLVAAPGNPAPSQLPTEEPVLPSIQPPLPTVETPRPAMPLSSIPSPEMMPVILPSLPSPAQSSPARVTRFHRAPSTQTGKDAVTEQAVGGAIIDKQPDYLSNPPPIYPEDARDQGEEGVVTLDVIVSTDGCAETVKVSSSSGFYLLDDSARAAVMQYRFRPATLKGMKFRSHVKVPIRFRLNG